MAGAVLYESVGGIARLTLKHPEKLNAISLDMWRMIPELVAQALKDPQVRVIALEGYGAKAFSAGADISGFAAERHGAAAVTAYDQAVEIAELSLIEAHKPTLALIRGFCFGGGLGLASACDIRLSNASARFCIPAAKLGIGYSPRGVVRLERLVGPSCAAEIFFTGRVYSSAEALAMGLVTRLLEDADFDSEVGHYLHAIAAQAPLSLRAAKLVLREGDRSPTEQNFAAAQAMVVACYESADYAEGQKAFAMRRPPVFLGR